MSSSVYSSTKKISLGSCAFRQWRATHSHCSKIHGYELQAKFWFAGPFLDGRNWIIDFGELGEIKDKLNKIFDHTFCVALDDPFLEDFKSLHDKGVIDMRVFERGVGIERVAEVCFEVASEYLKEKYGQLRWVDKVEVFEHDRNSAIFHNPNYVDNSVFAPTSEDATKIVQEYLKNEAELAKKQLKVSVDVIKQEVEKEFGNTLQKNAMLAELNLPTPEQVDSTIDGQLNNAIEKLNTAIVEPGNVAVDPTLPTSHPEPTPSDVAAVEPAVPTEPLPTQPGTGAPVGQKPTSGNYSGLFGGTRWG